MERKESRWADLILTASFENIPYTLLLGEDTEHSVTPLRMHRALAT